MDDLYRDQILEHYKRPHNFGRLENYDLDYEDTNPFCGDEQHVYIKLGDDGRVSDVSFEGQGCAISTAATSLLTDELIGKTREELLRMPKEEVLDLLGIDPGAIERSGHGDAAEVGRVHRGQRATHLPEGRTGGREDHGLRHLRVS